MEVAFHGSFLMPGKFILHSSNNHVPMLIHVTDQICRTEMLT
jgi:hypothetical protein